MRHNQALDVVGSVGETEATGDMIEMLGERGGKWVGTRV